MDACPFGVQGYMTFPHSYMHTQHIHAHTHTTHIHTHVGQFDSFPEVFSHGL